MTSWLTALRIARREARRAPGRSALVVALIGLPVWALSSVAVSYDMFTLTAEERLAREIGASDARLTRLADGPVRQDATGNPLETPVEEGPADEEGAEEGGAEEEGAEEGGAEEGGATADPTGTELTTEQVRALLPITRQATLHWYGDVRAVTAAGVGTLRGEALDLTNPLVRGIGRLTAGRAPVGPAEVALTASAATRLDAAIGDDVALVESDQHPAGRYRVTGLLEFPGRVASDRLAQRFPLLGDLTGIGARAVASQATVVFHPDGRPGPGWQTDWLVATSEPVTWEQVEELNRHGVVVYARAVALDPPARAPEAGETGGVDGLAFGIGVLVTGLAVLEVVLLAGPAFAVGARRRQRELALVAAGGGSPAQLRRLVLADGVLLGALGAAIGIALGIATAFAARPLVEAYLVGARAGGYRVFPLALAGLAVVAVGTGLLAALAPAHAAARQPVVAALAGRRGSTEVRRRWLVLGLAMVVLGAATAGAGAWQVWEPVVLGGLLVGQVGLVLCTPALIGLVARLGSRLPLAPRVALRDSARNRSAAAPAVSAIMGAVTGAAAAGVVVLSVVAGEPQWTTYPPGTAVVSVESPATRSGDEAAGTTARERAARAAAERAARAALPVDQVRQVSRPVCAEDRPCAVQAVVPPEHRCPYWDRPRPLPGPDQRAASGDPRCGNEIGPEAFVDLVDDGSALAVLTGADPEALAPASAVLRDGGVVATDRRLLSDDGTVRIRVAQFGPTGPQPRGQPVYLPGYLLPVDFQGRAAILSPGAARALGLEVAPGPLVISTTRMPTQAEEDAFAAAMADSDSFGFVVREYGEGVAPALAGLAVAAGLIALGAAGIATGLAAADRRPDLATLAAVGASPRVRRALALSQSAVIAGLGTGLGLLVGVGAAVAALIAINQRYASTWPSPDPIPVLVPWPQLAVLVAVPVVAMLGAGLLTRSRLPVERRPT